MYGLDEILDRIGGRLDAQNVPFLIIGGHAMNAHGFTRATQDIDFMIPEAEEGLVRALMAQAGFSNQATNANVLFCNQPGSPLRIDFLKTDRETLERLLAHSIPLPLPNSRTCRVASAEDLIAMKLHALRNQFEKRRDKDIPDIIFLLDLLGWDAERDLKPLCEKFGNPRIFNALSERMGGKGSP